MPDLGKPMALHRRASISCTARLALKWKQVPQAAKVRGVLILLRHVPAPVMST